MWAGYDALSNQLQRVLGEPAGGDTFIRHVEFWTDSIAMEVAIRFANEEIPKNFLKKGRDLLLFNLFIPDFSVALEVLDPRSEHGRIREITDQSLVVDLGSYRFRISAPRIHFGRFRGENYDFLVDTNQL